MGGNGDCSIGSLDVGLNSSIGVVFGWLLMLLFGLWLRMILEVNRLGLGLVMSCLAFVVGCFETVAVLAPILGVVVEIVGSLLLVVAAVVGFLLLLLLSLPLTSFREKRILETIILLSL